MFLDQKGKYPFPKVTPIRIPSIIDQLQVIDRSVEPITNSEIHDICSSIKEWYNPLIQLDQFKYSYLMNNGITQGLETLGLMYKNIHLLQGDYFWLKTIKAGLEVTEKVPCEISYASCPSAVDGNVIDTSWPSNMHILDGAYIGTSLTKTFIPENTEIILLGFSKNLGVPELRSGIIFSKRPIQHLEVFQKTFGYIGPGVFRAILKVCKHMPINSLAEMLKHYQENFCKIHTELIPSDSALLATTEDLSYAFYKRPNGIIRVPLGESITKSIENNLI